MFESIALALAFGTFWFWIVSFGMFCLILALAENEQNWWAGISVLSFLLLMQWAGTWDFLGHPLQTLIWFLVYFVIGAFWSVAKWISLLYSKKDQLKNLLKTFIVYAAGLENCNSDDREALLDVKKVGDLSRGQFVSFVVFAGQRGYRANPYDVTSSATSPSCLLPDRSYYKDRFVGWLLWWPTSMFWTLLNDPLIRLARWVVTRLGTFYDRLAAAVFKDLLS